MAGLLNMAGLSLTGAFNGTQLRAPTPAARVSHTGFSVVAVSAATAHFSRRRDFPTRRGRDGQRATRREAAARMTPRDSRRVRIAVASSSHASPVSRVPTAPRRRPSYPARATCFRVRVWVFLQRAVRDKIGVMPPSSVH